MTRFALAALLLVGCSSSTTTPDTAPGPIAHDFNLGTEDVVLGAAANGGVERMAWVNFALIPGSGIDCTVGEMVDGCVIRTCPSPNQIPRPNLTPIELGSVSVTSASLGTVSLVPAAGETLARVIQPGDFAPDELVRISSTGSAAVPAFTLEAKVPAALTPVSIGNCTVGSETCALSDAAPVATWTGGGEVVIVSIGSNMDLPETKSLSCAFDGSRGEGRIPARALAKLPRNGTYGVGIGNATNSVTSGRVRFSVDRAVYKRVRSVKLPD